MVTEVLTTTDGSGGTSLVTIVVANPTPFNSDANHTGTSQYVKCLRAITQVEYLTFA